MAFHAVNVVLLCKCYSLTALKTFKGSHKILSKSGAEAPDYYANERATTMRKVDDAKSTVEPDSF